MDVHSMKHVVRLIRPDNLPAADESILPLLTKAHKHTPEYEVEDTIADVIREKAYLFTIDDTECIKGVAVVRAEEFPRKTYLLIQMLGGDDIFEWVDEFRDRMRETAEHLEFDGVVLYGRQGWTKVFKDLQVERVMLIDKVGV